MTRLEAMGINLATPEGLAKVMTIRSCYEIDKTRCGGCSEEKGSRKDCVLCMATHLLAEVPTKKVKRLEAYGGSPTVAWIAWNSIADRKQGVTAYNFAQWLEDEIEVPV